MGVGECGKRNSSYGNNARHELKDIPQGISLGLDL